MIKSSDMYKIAITADTRRMMIRAVIDIIDPDIVYGDILSESITQYSVPDELYDKEFDEPPKYATIEQNRWLLDGTWKVHPDSGKINGDAYSSDEIADGDGVFTPAQYVEMQFSNVSILQALTVYFPGNNYDGVPCDFTIEVKQGGVTYYTKEVVGNTETKISLDGFTVYNPDAIRVTVTRWSIPYRRMRVVEIVPGIYEKWDGNIIASFSLKHQGDVSCVSLPYGTCTISMDNLDRRFEPRRKDGIFQSIEERQGIPVSIGAQLPDGTVEYKQAGVFYQYSGGWKTGDNGLTMQWILVDIIGLLSDRDFIPPDTLPTTLSGWAAALVSQLGTNFAERYTVDANYSEKPVTVRENDDVQGMKCKEIIRYVCMASGTFPRADAETGNLCFEPMWNEGNKIILENMESYPALKANDDLAAIIFTLNDGNSTKYVVSGNSTASSNTVSVNNPFIHTQEEALAAARLILSAYGGNKYEITGRGDPASEIGDVDTIWLDESSAVTARRIQQDLSLSGGVMQGLKSILLQADGSNLYKERAIFTENGTFVAPDGVTELRLILVGRGKDGGNGTDGTWDEAGKDGADGSGALVWAGTIPINPNQSFQVSIGENTTFGAYTSAQGAVFSYGYTDIASGNSYARTGVSAPINGSGDGGAGGKGGVKGNAHYETIMEEDGSSHEIYVIDNYPGSGTPGVNGVTGCAIVYWDR